MRFIFVNIMMGMYRGGGENFDLNLSRELAQKGHDVEFYFLRPLLGKVKQTFPGYCATHPVRAPWLYLWTQRLQALPGIGRVRGLRGLPRWVGQVIFEFHVLFQLWQRRREAFVVHICGLSLLSALATKLLGNRVFVRFPGPPSFRMHLWCIRNTYAVIANGDAFNCIQKMVPTANLIRLEVGIDHNLFQRVMSQNSAREVLCLPKEKVLALFVGRLVSIKNVHMLVRAMARVAAIRADIDLVIVGAGPEQARLEQAIFELGLRARIHFLGDVYGERLRTCYTAADFFVLSSHYDNFPNVVIEAMAMELPVVATKVGGIPSQVEHGLTGYLVDQNDDEDMAARMISMAANPEMMLEFGKRAATIVRYRHAWDRSAECFLQCANKSLELSNG